MNINKKKKIIFLSILILIGLVIYFINKNNNNYEINENELIPYEESENKVEEEIKETEKIVIYITGEVNNSGVYEFERNCRITDAINKAGGLKELADITGLNLAFVLEDGMKIYVPSVNENKNILESNNYTSENFNKISSKININKASQTELETLPGIGPSTALKIINYRTDKEKFSKIEDIKNVSGIGDNKFEEIKNLICV